MLTELFEFLKAREERITIGGQTLVIKEMTGNADRKPLTDGVDVDWKILVRCVFKEDGGQLFSDADIPKLKDSGTTKVGPLLKAVYRVNGLDVEAEAKNSEAAQTSSSS
jgi:hypothetical protein